MSVQRPAKRWGWALIIPVIALLGVGLWIGFSSAADLLTGHLGSNMICNSDDPVLLAPTYSIADLTVDGQSLYWLTRGNPGAVMKMAKNSGKVQVLAKLQSEPYGILVDNQSVFWVEGSWQPGPSFVLNKVDKHGGDIAELWQAPETMIQLNSYADHLYWLDYENKALLRIPKMGGEPEALISGLDGLSNFTIVNGQIYLGGSNWMGILEQQDQMPKIVITADRLLQELQVGLRDERSVYFAGPVMAEYNGEIIFMFYVGNNPGMISCTDNVVHIVGLPETSGTSHIILSVAGALSDFVVIAPYLYSIGNCWGGQMVNFDTGEAFAIDIGYDAFNLAADKSHLYWADREGLKCIRRSRE